MHFCFKKTDDETYEIKLKSCDHTFLIKNNNINNFNAFFDHIQNSLKDYYKKGLEKFLKGTPTDKNKTIGFTV